jgi:hypothetical protein
MATFWATFDKTIKTWFVEGVLRFQKWFDVDVLDLALLLIFWHCFGLETVWATFDKLGDF